ncbi:hypothetical protein E6C67_14245 [Azospirillum sp. TSA2s]|uniref:hypothetical protein n=1 Tax=Azospirillum sp. TSA2s TaxID=709810 RepID=UPI0010AB1065|nr:hypothetical protein [Azospirillum sp. TSA2s]QCG94989.1 hypothetical protein E6C67_14245 [Azospirillum sp. TSA2s]
MADGEDWYSAQRAKVEAARATERNAWPHHCHSPSSCTRNQACMYWGCRHEGEDIRSAISAHEASKEPRR